MIPNRIAAHRYSRHTPSTGKYALLPSLVERHGEAYIGTSRAPAMWTIHEGCKALLDGHKRAPESEITCAAIVRFSYIVDGAWRHGREKRYDYRGSAHAGLWIRTYNSSRSRRAETVPIGRTPGDGSLCRTIPRSLVENVNDYRTHH